METLTFSQEFEIVKLSSVIEDMKLNDLREFLIETCKKYFLQKNRIKFLSKIYLGVETKSERNIFQESLSLEQEFCIIDYTSLIENTSDKEILKDLIKDVFQQYITEKALFNGMTSEEYAIK